MGIRRNALIERLVQQDIALGTFVQCGDVFAARRVGDGDLDFVIVDFEHEGFDFPRLGETLQWLISRRRIVATQSPWASPTPIVRIPANGAEQNQWIIKQALDYGAYGIVVPQIRSAEDALAAVRSIRYPQGPGDDGPPGHRGAFMRAAPRYWGCTSNAEYVRFAELWPLRAEGELVFIPLIEDRVGFENIEQIVAVPGVSGIIFGSGDGAMSLGSRGVKERVTDQLDAARARVVAACHAAGVVAGVAGVTSPDDVERYRNEGFRLFASATDGVPLR